MREIIKILFCSAFISVLIFGKSYSQFTFVHITDIHVSDGNSYVNNSDINGVLFGQMLANIRGLNPMPAFVVASGDLINVGNSGYGAFPNLIQYLYPSPLSNPQPGDYYIDQAQSIPIYFTPGNHEYYTTLIPPLSDATIVNYISYLSPDSDYEIIHNNAALFFLRSGYDSFRPIWDDANITNPEGSGISDSQCTWLRTAINNNPDKKKIIIMHHPPVDVVGTNVDGTPSTATVVDAADGSIINNRQTLLNICDSNNVDITLSGHVHQNAVADSAGNSVNENWTGGTRFIQTAPELYGGYRIITIDSSFVSVGVPQMFIPTGIAGYSSIDNLYNIYYNPIGEAMTVFSSNDSDQSDIQISLYNITGQQVISRHSFAVNGTHVIQCSGLSKGFYLITIQNGNKNYTQKIIIN